LLFAKLLKLFGLAGSRRTNARPPEPFKNEKGAHTVVKNAEIVAYRCGHDGVADFSADIYGEVFAPRPEVLQAREKCPECMLAQLLAGTIRCAICGLLIPPNDPVALYRKCGKERSYAYAVGDKVIGCLRDDCCPSGGFYAGRWSGKEFVPEFRGRTIADEAFRTGKPQSADLPPDRR
jgi:hypothetical protein